MLIWGGLELDGLGMMGGLVFLFRMLSCLMDLVLMNFVK